MNKRNTELGLLVLLLAGLEIAGMLCGLDTDEPKSDPNHDPNHDPDQNDFDAEEADEDYQDFPVTYLSDIFRTREDDRIDDNPRINSTQRANMRKDMDSFVDYHAADFDKIEASIGAMYKALPPEARPSFLDGIADYCEMMKDEPQEVMIDALERRFEV